MSTGDSAAGGPGDARRWSWTRIRPHRPTGIRNGGLLLILVAVAGVMALVDRPEEGRQGLGLPGIFQHLPPPVGITQEPPAPAPSPDVGQPGPGGSRLAEGERPTAARRHPLRAHPRPVGPGSSGVRRAESALTPSPGPSRTGSGGTGSGGSGSGGPERPPPVTTAPPPASASVRVRVPPARVRVTPPTVAGREPPAVQVETPEVSVEVPVSVPPVTLPRR